MFLRGKDGQPISPVHGLNLKNLINLLTLSISCASSCNIAGHLSCLDLALFFREKLVPDIKKTRKHFKSQILSLISQWAYLFPKYVLLLYILDSLRLTLHFLVDARQVVFSGFGLQFIGIVHWVIKPKLSNLTEEYKSHSVCSSLLIILQWVSNAVIQSGHDLI